MLIKQLAQGIIHMSSILIVILTSQSRGGSRLVEDPMG